jgi:hypothetical protein
MDALNLEADANNRTRFFVADAVRTDGSAVTLSAVRFIKVQTGALRYGGIFWEIPAEINSADFLDSQTDFPKPGGG